MGQLVKVEAIKNRIFELRGQKIMLDQDIARLYGIKPFRMREQVKRNIKRFPEDFMFRLNEHETELMVSQNAIPSRQWLGGHKPYAFTRNGVNMLAAVLRSQIAIDRSIFIMRAFSALEEAVGNRKYRILSSPAVMKELSVHSRAIMRLFQEVNMNKKQIGSIERIQKEMSRLIQKIIIASLE